MVRPVAPRASRLPSYSGTLAASLRLAAVVALALGASGCAVSGQLDSLFGRRDKSDAQFQARAQGQSHGQSLAHSQARAQADMDVTGSISRTKTPAISTSKLPSETDLVFARMAIVDVLKRGSKSISAPWENPSSGARGTVTPIASAYNQNGATCRGFLASYVRQSSEAWLQGEACRESKGEWEVKSLRPWKRS